jgi:REP element-mobilizing transposase RayT
MPRSRYRIHHTGYPHFLTATINHWQPLFTRTETANIVLDSWRFLQQEADFKIYGYVLLENHLHLIAASADLSRDMQRFKSWTARQLVDYLQQRSSARVLEILARFKRAHKTA